MRWPLLSSMVGAVVVQCHKSSPSGLGTLGSWNPRCVLPQQEVLKHMTSAEAATRRPQRDMTADDEDWRLAAAARFSPEQQAAICALRGPHFVNIGRLRARRAALSAQLQVPLLFPNPAAPLLAVM
jgi:hypothetical protein